MSKLVITGADGFIGAALTRRFPEACTPVVGVQSAGRDPCGHNAICIDLRTPGALDSVLEPDSTVFHLAGSASVPASVADPVHDLGHTFQTTFEVLESVRRAGARMIFASTASVYDTSNPLPFREHSLVRPSSPYGAAKLSGENYCIAYHRSYGLDTRIARITNVYGPGMSRSVIRDVIEKIGKNQEEITIRGDGNQIRDFLYIEDAVDALLCIAANGKPGNEYNVGAGEPIRILDLIHQIAAAMGCPSIRIKMTPASSGELERFYVEVAKLKSIGFAPKVTFPTGLEQTLASFMVLKNSRRA